MKILPANIDHVAELAKLFDAYRVFYRKKSDLQGAIQFLYERLKNQESKVYVALDIQTTKIVGFAQLYPIFSSTRMARLWLLNDLYVDPEFRGKGISKQLLDRAKELAVLTRAAGLSLETEKSNEIGNNLYLKTDFILEEDHNFYFWLNPSFDS